MHWNHRIVGDKDGLFLAEVYYDKNGSILGWATPRLGGDAVEEFTLLGARIIVAASKPVLHLEDFPQCGTRPANATDTVGVQHSSKAGQ